MFRFRLLLGCCLCAILLVCAHRADAESLTVGWDTVSGVAGYVVSYGTNEGNYTTNVDAGNQTQKQIDGLASGTMYYFVVRSYDGAGHLSNPSADVAGMTSGTPSTPPSIECPTPVAASPDGKPVAAIFSASVFGGTAPVNVSCSPASGSLFPVGSTPASCTATDALQLTASCNTTVVVTYNAPSGPAPLTMMCPAPSATSGDGKPVVVTFAPNVAGGTAPISTSCAPASGSTFAVGSTAFTCRSVDAKSVSASCTSSVTVSSAASPNPNPTPAPAPGLSPVNAPLAISCPLVDPVISQSGAAMPVTFAPAVTGGIAPITTSCLPASGTSFAVGATGVVCSVTDGARQIDSCAMTVTVVHPGSAPSPGAANGVPIAFTGIVAGLAGHCPSATFDIGSIFVTTTAATNYAKGACQSNSDGKVVAVQGLLQSNGTVIATALTYITNRADDPHQRMKTDPTGSSGR